MSLAKNSFIYLFSNIINSAIPFLLLPILTRVLSQEEYGQIAMFQTLVVGLTAFVGLNTVGAANRKFYDLDINKQDISEYNGACIQVLLFSITLLLIVLYFTSGLLASFLAIPVNWLYSALLFSSFSFVLNLRLGQWQIRGQAFKFGQLQISNSLFNVGLSLLLVIVFHHGAQGRIDSQVIAAGLSAVAAYWLLTRDNLVSLWQWRSDYIKQTLNFGVPLVPHIFGAFLLSSVDRFVINSELGLSQAGIYMVAVQLSMALGIIFDAINKAYIPWLFDVLKQDEDDKKIKAVKYSYIYFLLLLLISPIAFLLGPWAVTIIAGEEYRAAGQVLGFLCLGQMFGGMYLMVTNYIFFAKKTATLSIVTITSGLINVVLLIVLVKNLGVIGAALAFTISKAILFLFTWLLAYRYVQMPWFSFWSNSRKE